jgi:hypothetical protein
MKQLTRLALLLALMAPLLGSCGLPAQAGPLSFDLLAQRLPGDVQQAFFLDLKPAGEAGAHWQRIRDHLAANSEAQALLDSLLSQFRVQDFGLDPFVVGPVANGSLGSTQYCIVQVNSQSAARDAVLLQNKGNPEWKSESYQGRTLYHRSMSTYGQPEWLAFAAYDGLLVLAFDYNIDAIDNLKTLVGLSRQDSLAALPSWQTVYARLPQAPMGLFFLNLGEQLQQNSSPGSDPSLGLAFGQQIEALALAAVPERNGMRVDVVGTIALQDSVPPEIRSLLGLPGVDPASWAGLPADTAMVVSGHNASIIWPVLRDLLSVSSLSMVRDAIGLDIEADLFNADGPLSDDFCVALLPPLPDQPIGQGLLAGQLLFLGRDASPAQMDALQAAMESRGAVLSPQEIQGVLVQAQVGTELAGYAVSFGLNDQDFVLGTSPGALEQSVTARRAGNGLVKDAVFQAVLDALPRNPSFLLYVNRPSLTDVVQINMTEQQYTQSQELVGLEAFDAIGLGLKLGTDVIEGALYFFMAE